MGEEEAYLEVPEVVVWVGAPGVEGRGGDQEGGPGVCQVGVQGAGAAAWAPSDLQACRGASRTEGHLGEGREAAQTEDRGASLEEPGEGPVVEALLKVDPACVGALAEPPLVQRAEACADWA